MVKDGRLRGARRAGVVVRGDRVEELVPHVRREPARTALDQPQAEMDVP